MSAGMKNAFLLALALVVIGLVAALFFLKRSNPPEGEQESIPVAAH
jgi:hypothetical protein